MPSEVMPGAAGIAPLGDDRALRACREWLAALTSSPEAALAAALAYDQLEGSARDSWIETLGSDADEAEVPRFAVYAPLLAVELDEARRARISEAIGQQQTELVPATDTQAYAAEVPGGSVLHVIVRPLYLDFVQVLACCVRPGQGFEWVKHEPILRSDAAPKVGDELSGVELEKAPLKSSIDELAHAVVSHHRRRGPVPDALRTLADLFSPVPADPGPLGISAHVP